MSLTELSSYQLACLVAGMVDDKKASDIVILDISRVSVMADYFVICSTDTSTQLRALGDLLVVELKNNFNRPIKSEQRDKSGKWYLFDYGDVVVHILHKEARDYYALEQFWSHAFVVDQEKWQNQYIETKNTVNSAH